MTSPRCPHCQEDLDDDFGIVDCKSCGAVCSVDLEGEVSLQGEVGDQAVESTDVLEPFEGAGEIVTPSDETSGESSSEFGDAETGVGYDYGDEDMGEHASGEPDSIDDGDWAEASTEDTGSLEHANTLDAELDAAADSNLEALDEPRESLESMNALEFLKDLEVFTEENADENTGHVYYDLLIKGLNDRDLFMETLVDERLELSEDYLSSLMESFDREGFFILAHISLLRLSVICKRLMPLGLTLSWTPSAQDHEELSNDSYTENEVD